MKVLVIDDDPNAQKILRALFQRLGCDPIICNDAEAGLKQALGEEPPWIIVCDWKPPVLDTPAFCRQLRADTSRFRPYLIVLTTRSAKEDIATALDAGADDFITKPFNLIEMQARIRAAVRLVSYQCDLQRQARELATANERNKLLGEMLTNQNGTRIPKIMQESAAAVTAVRRATTATPSPHHFSQYDVRYIISSSLIELRLVLESAKERLLPPNLRNEDFCAWAPIFLPGSGQWIDLLLSGSYTSSAALFERSLHRKPVSTGENLSFMTELVRIISHGFLRSLALREPAASQPFTPKTINLSVTPAPPPMVPRTHCHDLLVEGCAFRLVLATSACPREEIAPTDLREMDILSEQLPPPGVSDLPLFHRGTVMSSHFVTKVRELTELSRVDYTALRHRPSLVALQMLGA